MKKKTHIARQALRLKRGEINRRRFIMSALATGVTLPTATSLAHRAEAAQPKFGGVLRFGVADPIRLTEIQALATGNTLLEVGEDGDLTGDLASSFVYDQHARRWTVNIHKDVTFQDGKLLTADDVVASLSQKDTPGIRGQIKSMRAGDAHTVIIDLIQPNPDFAWALSDPSLTIRSPSGMGTGSYRQSQNLRRLRKVSAHWKSDRGHFDALDLIPLPDPSERLTALLNNEVDLIDDVDPRTFGLLAHTPDISLLETEGASIYGLARQAETSPDVGRALNDVTDRRDLARKVLLGHGKAADNCSACRNHTHYDGAPITLGHKSAFPGVSDMLSLVADMAKDKGLPVDVGQSNKSNFTTERLRIRPTLDWTLADALARRPDEKLQGLLNKARGADSSDERAAHQANALCHLEAQGDIFPLLANDIHAHRSALRLTDGTFDALRVAERGWFA